MENKQAKPTWYKNVLFRSKLEASWARIFDLMEIQWEYEPCKFSWSNGSYIPDFKVKIQSEDWFVEVKGYITPEWHIKLRRFVDNYIDKKINLIIVGTVPWGANFQKIRESIKKQIKTRAFSRLFYRAMYLENRQAGNKWFVMGKDGEAKLVSIKETDYADVDTKRTTEIYNAVLSKQWLEQINGVREKETTLSKEQEAHSDNLLPAINIAESSVDCDETNKKMNSDNKKKLPIPPKRERKSKRVSLLIRPSLYKTVKSWASERQISVNELMEYALLEFIELHK